MMDRFVIKLHDLRFFSRIGVFEQERRVGNEFIVNVEVEVSASTFVEEDLTTSISYADIYEEVKDVMSGEWLLLETVAVKIRRKICDRWDAITSGSISIEKLAPPIVGIDGSCGVEYKF